MTDLNPLAAIGDLTAGANALRMKIDDVFSITGRGVVAVGVIDAGTVSVGDDIDVSQDGRTVAHATVGGVEMLRKLVDEATVGDHVGLLLRGVERDDLARGMTITGSGALSMRVGTTRRTTIRTTVGGETNTTTTFSFSGSTPAMGGVVDKLSDAAASAADHKDFTKGEEFRGLGFSDDSTPGHVGSAGSSIKRVIAVILLLAVVAAAARLGGFF